MSVRTTDPPKINQHSHVGTDVGGGFIRPEVTTFCVNGRYLPRIDERAYLGTDKSVPYENHVVLPAVPRSLCASVLLCEMFLTNNERR